MSNRRRPERRDAHGAPVRSRNEILIAIGTAVGVIVVTAVLLIWLQNDAPTTSAPLPVSSTTTAKATSSTTAAAVTTTSSAATTSSSTASSSTSATSATSTSTSTTKP